MTYERYSSDQSVARLQVEQALIGCIVFDNDAFANTDGLKPEHFSEPLHQRMWALARSLIESGKFVEPILIAESLKSDPAFWEMGGLQYLSRLIELAPPLNAASSLAEKIKEAWRRRELLNITKDIAARSVLGQESVAQLMSDMESALLAMQVGEKSDALVSAASATRSVIDALDSVDERGTPTGLEPLDAQLGAMQPGDLVLFMGRPSMGKSAAAECVALNIAERKTAAAPKGFGVIQINGEMSPEQMTRRHISDVCFRLFGDRGPKYSDIRKRDVSPIQREMITEAGKYISDLPITMIKRPGIRLGALRSLIRRQASKWAREGIPLGAVIVDHVGLIRPDESMRDRYADQTVISNGMKELADELNCLLIALNQMNRQSEGREDKRPQLSDLRDSGSWEQDADIVIGWYREAYYANREQPPGGNGIEADLKWADWSRRCSSKVVEAIILKAREGECGKVELWADVARNAIRGSEPVDPLNYRRQER